MLSLRLNLWTLFLLSFQATLGFAQTEWASIPLNPMRGSINEIRQFPDEQGNLLLQIKGDRSIHFGLIQPDRKVLQQSFKLLNQHQLIESIYDEKHFMLFYEKAGSQDIYLYRAGKERLYGKLLKTDAGSAGEKPIMNAFVQGDFLSIFYSKSPFTIHTYRYDEQRHFEKGSQSFTSEKQEYFWGKVKTANEAIIIRYSRNPLTMHLYRYVDGNGFEKKSFQVRPIYEEAGVGGGKVIVIGENDRHLPVAAHIEGDDIYLEMEPLITLFSLKGKRKRPYPGVLRLNWEEEKGELLSFSEGPLPKLRRRDVALVDSLYIQMLIHQKRLNLYVYNVENQQLLKQHSFSKKEMKDFIYGSAKMEKEFRLGSGWLGGIPFYSDKELKPKRVLRELSNSETFLEAFNHGDVIELSMTGFNDKEFNTNAVSGFTSYLSTKDLEVIKSKEETSDPKWQKVQDYLDQLDEEGQLGEYSTYEYQGRIHLAYINEVEEVCKIIAF